MMVVEKWRPERGSDGHTPTFGLSVERQTGSRTTRAKQPRNGSRKGKKWEIEKRY
jgi:hypothetical protein